jgi:hypothetical protein
VWVVAPRLPNPLRPAPHRAPSHADDAHALWLNTQAHVAPLKRKK